MLKLNHNERRIVIAALIEARNAWVKRASDQRNLGNTDEAAHPVKRLRRRQRPTSPVRRGAVLSRHTVIIEYHRTDLSTDQMVVRNVYGDIDYAKRQCARIRRRLNARENVVVDHWRIEDAMERVVARSRV